VKNFKNGILRGIGSVASGMTLVASVAVLLTGAPASAATSCTGTVIDSAPTTDVDNGARYGTLYLHYNSATGRNCAKATNTTGGAHEMMVWLTRCAAGTGNHTMCSPSDGTEQGANYDHGTYHEYAGPVNTLGSAAGRCVEAFTWIQVGSRLGEVDITGHCG
jgi:hypothetical protein